MNATPSRRALRACPNCKLDLLAESVVPPHRLRVAVDVGVSVYGGNGLCPASCGPWDGPSFFGGTDWRGSSWEYARGEEPTITVRWKAILETLGIAQIARSNHEFVQMANNVVYLAERAGVKTGYRWELR